MYKTLKIFKNGSADAFNHNSDTLNCDPSSGQVPFAKEGCVVKDAEDPFDILGKGLYATDLNCHHKMRVGWLKSTDVITIANPNPDATDFKPSEGERVALVNQLGYK